MVDPDILIDEESELNPLSVYAETKVGTERSLLDMSSKDTLGVTVLRFATLFGLSPRVRLDLTVNEFTTELMATRKLSVFGEQFWRPYVHVRDAARAIVLVLNSPASKVEGKVFNVGDTNQNYTKGGLVQEICDRIGGEFDIERVRKEEDPRDYRVSFEKIKQELDFKITRTVSDGIEEIVDAVNQGALADLDNPRYRN
jgi:nucleoside-diphosphate-sugar epimerase